MKPYISAHTNGNNFEIYINGMIIPFVKEFTITNTTVDILLQPQTTLDENIITTLKEMGFVNISIELEDEDI